MEVEVIEEKTPRRRSNKGFTLIELLIVIVILGVLSGVVVFAVGGITGRGQTSACKADLATMRVAVEAYRANDPAGAFPANEAALVPGFMRSASAWYDIPAADGVITLQGATCTAVAP